MHLARTWPNDRIPTKVVTKSLTLYVRHILNLSLTHIYAPSQCRQARIPWLRSSLKTLDVHLPLLLLGLGSELHIQVVYVVPSIFGFSLLLSLRISGVIALYLSIFAYMFSLSLSLALSLALAVSLSLSLSGSPSPSPFPSLCCIRFVYVYEHHIEFVPLLTYKCTHTSIH